ncbi:NAD(P)H-dependent flavin oxidoreductase [Siphonobacter curvatus]|nr:nitronate monooxygenase family protein [Siphonobacter curvatus]
MDEFLHSALKISFHFRKGFPIGKIPVLIVYPGFFSVVAAMQWTNPITQLYGIDYPIIQAPMLGVTTPAMVAGVSNAGGLGSLPVGGLSADLTQTLIRQTKALTNRPFAVNLFTHAIPEPEPTQVEAMQAYLSRLAQRHALPYESPDFSKLKGHSYTEQLEVLVQEKIPIVSFTFGRLSPEAIRLLKNAGCLLNGTATSVAEAEVLAKDGMDVITVQGIEAGGHRGTFLTEEPLPQVGLMALLPQVAERVSIPLLAAGGIYNGRGIRAAFTLGASGVQMGTAFTASAESAAIPAYKDKLFESSETDTALTRSFSGRWARGIRNAFLQEVEQSGLVIPAYPIQNSLTTPLRKVAQQQNNAACTTLWAGQAASKAEAKSVADIIKRLVAETEAVSALHF